MTNGSLGGSDPYLKNIFWTTKKHHFQKILNALMVMFCFFLILEKIILEGVLNFYDEGKLKFSAL